MNRRYERHGWVYPSRAERLKPRYCALCLVLYLNPDIRTRTYNLFVTAEPTAETLS